MKMLSRLLVFFCAWVAAAQMVSGATSGWVADYNQLLAKYATPSGVKYGAWKKNGADMQALQGVVDAIATEKVSGSKKEQLAFYLNAYNAWILHEALEKYPTSSVKDLLFTFFTSKRIKVAGQQTSFKAFEDDVIRAKFGEPRIHFALNCASGSCPPLQREAFEASKLEAQLENLAKGYVNSERGVKLSADGKTAQLSQIFEWYEGDFKNGGPVAFINQRRSKPIPKDAKISYQKYDWSLNEAK
ncbi:MAG: DUF547 domain-containing protein [Chthoniobacterales bacterium]